MKKKTKPDQGWRYLSLIIVFLAFSIQSFAYDFLVDGIYYKITNSSTKEVAVTLKLYDGGGKYDSPSYISDYTGDVTIPSSVVYNGTTYSVTGIDDHAFDDSDVTSVSIPSTVKSIGNSAFVYCTLLTEIEIPSSVTSFGTSIFTGSGITEPVACGNTLLYCPPSYEGEYHIPMGITEIAGSAFSGCNKITKVIIPYGVTRINSSTFYNCTSLENINMTSTLTYVDQSAFYGCSSLKECILPPTVSGIGKSAFYSCTSLESIILPASMTTSVADDAFGRCQSLNTVVFPAGVTNIRLQAFMYTSVRDVYNFASCLQGRSEGEVGLESSPLYIHVPSGWQNSGGQYSPISGTLVYDLESISSISISNASLNLTKGDTSTLSCTILPSTASVKTLHWSSNNTDVAIVDNNGKVTAIGAGSATITVSTLDGSNLFQTCVVKVEHAPTQNITFADDNVKAICIANWDTNGDGELSESEAAAVTDIGKVFYNNTQITSFDELKYFTGLTSIGSSAFNSCRGLTSVTIPNTVHSLGDYSFAGCKSLTTINIPEEVYYIGMVAFRGCESLLSVTIPSSVTTIYEFTFDGCTNLSSVTLSENLQYIGTGAFSGSKITSITLPPSFTTSYQINYISSSGTQIGTINTLNKVVISKGVTSLYEVFRFCPNIQTVICYNEDPVNAYNCWSSNAVLYVPKGTKEKYEADSNWKKCSRIIEMDSDVNYDEVGDTFIENGVTYMITGVNPREVQVGLLSGAIDKNTVGDIEIPSTVTNPSNNQEYTVASICKNAFYSCSKLNSVTIPNSVTSIGRFAFSGCSGLNSVVSEIEVPFSIDNSYVFDGISSTCKLTVPSGTTDAYIAAGWTENVFKGGIVEAAAPQEEQSLELASLPTMTYGDASYTLPATTTEGLTLTWTSGNTSVATISGNTLSIVGAGTATITASQAGNEEYKPFSREFALTVAKAPLTITANDATKNVGDANPAFTASYEGFVGDDDATVLTAQPSFTCEATSESPAGTYDITVSGAEAANYEMTYVKGTLTVMDETPMNNTLALTDVQVLCGRQVILPVSMSNTEDITAIQFDLTLPAGVSIAKNTKGKYIVEKTERCADHTLSASKPGEANVYKVLLYSTEVESITGNEGAVIDVTLEAAEDMEAGEYEVSLSNINLTTKAEKKISPADATCVLTVRNSIPGDANGDGTIDVTDIVGIANGILGHASESFDAVAADVNGDGSVDVTDIVVVANIILHDGGANAANVRGAMQMLDPQ